MNGCPISLAGETLEALANGALWWADRRLLVVSDLHLGKSERIARRGGALLPPYETAETMSRLAQAVETTGAETVICLGDSFDDLEAIDGLSEEWVEAILTLQAGRRWLWIEGNHDPGPIGIGGSHRTEISLGGLVFRHIAQPGATGEVSGHYHPKARLSANGAGMTRPAFLVDRRRIIMPAFGAYTGGLHAASPPLCDLLENDALAILTGRRALKIPMPRAQAKADATRSL